MMGDNDNSKDWPSLNDSNVACGSSNKSKHHDTSKDKPRSKESSNVSRTNEEKDKSNMKTDVTDGAHGFDNVSTSTNSKTGARKKQPGKTKWSPVQIDLPSYRDNRNDRNYNESHKFASGRRYNNYNNYESAHNIANGHENAKGRSFRGGRGGRGQFRYRRENTVNSDSRKYQAFSQDTASSQGINCYNKGSTPFSEALKDQLRRQIEYYFSAKNLVRDTYLRCHMDEQGYAHIDLIAEFPRIKRLTNDLKLILDAVKSSSHLEVSEDVKIRPVIDPLRWPLKPVICEANGVDNGEHFDLLSAQFYGMSINPVNYQFRGPKPLPGEFSWQFIPVENQDKSDGLFCVVNDVYPNAEPSSIMGAAAASSEFPNGHISPSDHLNSPNSDLYCEVSSQFIPNDYEVNNGTVVCPVPESHVVSNGISDIASDSNFPNEQACTSEKAQLPSNGEFSSHDLRIKTGDSFHPVNGNCLNGDSEESASACDLNLTNGLECSSDLRHMSEINPYCYYGSLPNGVIMYNSGGHYYVAHSAEVLSGSTDSSDEKSSLHNKSPEPSR